MRLPSLSALFLASFLALPAVAEEPVDAAAAEPEAAPEEPVAEPTAAEKALAAVPGLYRQRDRAGKAQQAIDLLEAALAEEPDNVELHVQVARFYFWIGDTASSDAQKVQLSKTCWDHAERVKVLAPSRVEGPCWSMACIGTHSEGVGILTAVRQGLAGKFEDNGKKAASISPNHDSGGPLRGLGRYYFMLPWPLQDLDDSRSYLERAYAAGPDHPRNLAYLADLELDQDNTEAARGYLDKIMAMSESSNANPPEVRRQQAWARGKLAELD